MARARRTAELFSTPNSERQVPPGRRSVPADDADDGGPDGRRRRPASVDRLGAALVAVALAAFLASLAFLPAHALRDVAHRGRRTAVPADRDQPRRGPQPRPRRRARRRPAGATSPATTCPARPSRRRRAARSRPHDPGLPRAARRRRWRSAGGSAPRSSSRSSTGRSPPCSCGRPSAASACRARVAVPVVLALTLAPPLAVYGAQVYPELPGALCVAGIVALTGAERRRGARRRPASSPWPPRRRG